LEGRKKVTEELELKYGVGALLYCPANNPAIISKITEQQIKPPYSVALCLEDAIADDAVADAEKQLALTLGELSARAHEGFYLPKLFVRVRSADHLLRLYGRLGESAQLLTGFILPKYSSENALAYNQAMTAVNKVSPKRLYMMPILESRDIISLMTRQQTLTRLKTAVDSVRELVLNVRVGGNDFCNCYGLRRPSDKTIYEIGILDSVLSDIANVFGADYVVSAPVWEYFESEDGDGSWLDGLRRELEYDRLNGFVGKTCIHPSQIEAVNMSLQVSETDYLDAARVLNWKRDGFGVEKSAGGDRMNEVKCHKAWAVRTMALAMIYGIRSEEYHEIHA
jgi:citrate lyase beta subunit